MPITTTVDNDRELTTHTVTGQPSFEEGMSTLTEFWEGRPTKNTLWDFREVILGRLTYGEVKKIIDYIGPRAKKRTGGKTGLVGSKDLVKGTEKLMVRYCRNNKLPFQIRAFRSIRKANKWLNQ